MKYIVRIELYADDGSHREARVPYIGDDKDRAKAYFDSLSSTASSLVKCLTGNQKDT